MDTPGIFLDNISEVTPKIIYFHYVKKVFPGSKYPENRLFLFGNRSTDLKVYRREPRFSQTGGQTTWGVFVRLT